QAFRKAMQLNPGSPEAHYNLGIALADAQRWDEAIEEYQAAIRLNAKGPEVINNLGLALTASRRWDLTSLHYQNAVRSRTVYAPSWVNLAMAYSEIGNSSKAIEAAQKGLSLAQAQGLGALASNVEGWLSKHQTGATSPHKPSSSPLHENSN